MNIQTVFRAPRPIETEHSFAAEVIAGLTAKPKHLPPKYFYDLAGSDLFDRITRLPEYYPTRSELALLSTARAGHGLAVSARLRSDRIRQRVEPESAHSAARGGECRGLRSG